MKPVEFDPFAGPEIIQVIDTIEPQMEIWISCLMGGADANRSYNESISLRLTGIFYPDAMQQALQEIVNRHEALRSTFTTDGKQICIYKELPVAIYEEDLSTSSSRQQEDFILAFTKRIALETFDLLNGPLFKTAIFKLKETEYYLTISAHHIICDGWSLGVILQDLSKIYSARSKNLHAALEPAPSFSKYSIDQTVFANTGQYREIEQYWINQYKSSVPVLDIPTDYPRPEERTYKSHREDFPIDPVLAAAIKKMGAKSGCTLVTTLMAAYEVFLHLITQQDEIVLGVPAAGQSVTGTYGLVGHCVNLLPMRSHPAGDMLFSDYLKKRKSQMLDDYEHQQITFGSLIKKLNINRDSSRIPLVPLAFNIDMGLDDGVQFEGLQHKLFYNPREFESFEIFINASGSDSSLVLQWSYNTQLFKPASIRRLMNEFEFLLQSIVEKPAVKIKDIPLLSAKDLLARLHQWNATDVDFPREKALHNLISETAEKFSKRIAVRCGDRVLNYGELNEKSNRLAGVLSDHGIKSGDIVGVALPRSAELIISLLAVLKTGAAYLPLDTQYPAERINYMLEDAGAKLVLTSSRYKGHFSGPALEMLIENAILKMGGYPKEDPQVKSDGNSLAYLLYTSGSTGKPKGVLVEHHNLVNLLYSMQNFPGITPSDKLLALTTISFDIAGLELFLPLLTGAELVLANEDDGKNGGDILDLLKTKNISIIQATPATYKLMLDAGWTDMIDVKILCCGEPLSKDLAAQLIPRCRALYNMYGPTETTIYSTGTQIFSADEIITIGGPIANTQVYILDHYLNPLAEGIVGEIYLAGEGVTRGYINQPELTAEKFLPDPFSKKAGARMYRSGDLGKFLEDGKIQCLGRIDHQIKIRGYRIEPGEIEQQLNGLPGIKESVVICREDKPGDQHLVAYVIADQPVKWLSNVVAIWRNSLMDLMPFYMVPNDFVILPKFPLTASGKIDRKSLPKPTQEVKEYMSGSLPLTDTEKKLASIWSQALGIDQISLEDDFFMLGGHSVVAAQVMRALEKQTGRKLPLTSLFKYPVLEDFAAFVSGEKKQRKTEKQEISDFDTEPELLRVPAIDPQREIWLSCVIGGEDANRSYNISMSEHLHGKLDLGAMEKAMQELINRHESLRSTFSTDGGEMLISRHLKLHLNYQDFSSSNERQQKILINQFVKQSAETAFDLLKGPLHNFTLFKLGEDNYYLTFSAHHIICDGWSLGVLMQELGSLYSAFSSKRESDLAKAPKFSDYARQQQLFYKSGDYEAIQQYWLNQFSDGVPVLEMPLDFQRPEERTYKSHRDDFALNPELVSKIRTIGANAGCSFAITLRAVFEIFVHRLTRQSDIVIGLPAAGQLATDNDGLTGHCVNLLPIRSRLDNNFTFIEYLSKRKMAILDAYDNQQLTFGTLLQKMNIARDNSRVPLVPLTFNVELGLDDGVDFKDLKHEMIFNPREFETFEIYVNAGGLIDSPSMQWSYNSQLFKASGIRRMMDEFEYVLQAFVAEPSQQIKNIPLRNYEAQLRQLNAWNNTAIQYPADSALHDIIDEVSIKWPDRISVEFGSQKLTYRKLREQSDQLAAMLMKKGIVRGDIVAVGIERSHEVLILLLGIMKAGAAYLPIDPDFPKERIEYMLGDANAKLLITSLKYRGQFKSQADEMITEDIFKHIGSYSVADKPVKVKGSDLVYILYTSGSTGRPKAVMIEHHSLVNCLLHMKNLLEVNKEDRMIGVTTISFDISGMDLYLPLISGALLIMADQMSARDGHQLLDLIKSSRPSIMQVTPITWQILIEAGWNENTPIKKICTAGEALTKTLAAKLLKRSERLYNMYGPTETTIFSTGTRIFSAEETITIGRPIANTQIYILDEQQQLLNESLTGEIWIGGDGVGRGYLNQTELTAEKFMPDPFSKNPGARMYRTGDLGQFMEDGMIKCLGRIDQQIKIRGFRIEPGEIEYLLNQYPGIKESVVISREDKPGDIQLVAYVVQETNSKADISAAWKKMLQKFLPYYMIPGVWVVLDALPITAGGKTDRRSLPKPEANAGIKNANFPPQTASEKIVAGIWEQFLGITGISMKDHFFELGGHSLIAVQVMGALEKETGKKLPLTTIFKYPVLEDFADLVREEKVDRKEQRTSEPNRIFADLEPEIIQVAAIEPQMEIWVSCMIGGEDANRSYNISMSEHLFGKLDRQAMEKSMQQLINRHDSLRLTFSPDGTEILIRRDCPLQLNFQDLTDRSNKEQKIFIKQFAKKNADTAFDLLKGPLHNFALFKLGEEEYYLTFSAHHIICDGWSLDVIMQELGKLYSANVSGLEPVLEKAPRFSDYAKEQQLFDKSEEYSNIQQYWLNQFSDGAPIVEIPTDFPRPDLRTYKSRRDVYPIQPELISQIKEIGTAAGSSLAITLRAAFEIFMHHQTQQSDIVIGLPAAGQLVTGKFGLTGHCVNMLPIRSIINKDLSFVEYLNERKFAVLDALANQRLTFGTLLQKMNIVRDYSRVPLVPMTFNVSIESDDDIYFKGLRREQIFNPREFETFELAVNASGEIKDPTIQWSYNTQLFKSSTIRRLMDEFEYMLKTIVENPSQKIKQISFLSAEQLNERLTRWNSTSYVYPKNKPLHAIIGEAVLKFPNNIALRFEDRSLTYRQLNAEANQLARIFLEQGIRPNDIVGLALPRSAEMIIALLAIMKSGAAYLPLDPQFPKERIDFMLQDSSAKLILTSKEYKGLFQSSAKELILETVWAKIKRYSDLDLSITTDGTSLAYLLYTSGSTGKPKGVMVEHRNLVNLLCSMQNFPGLSVNDKLLAVTTISFDIAGLELFLPLITGAELVLAADEECKDGRMLLDLIKNKNISIMQATPATFQLMLNAGWNDRFNIKILCGGEPLSRDISVKLIDRCQDLFNMYGPTETTIWSTCELIIPSEDLITIGRPIGNTQVYILDEYGNPLPEGVVGEITIGGDGVAKGYLNRAALQAERFIPDPFSKTPGMKMYRTGDLGKYLENGKIQCLGRIDHQIKIRGYRIEPGEIEQQLNQLAGVKESIVLAREDKPGNQQLVAYIVPDRPVADVTDKMHSTWKKTLKSALPYYMIPGFYVIMESLPLTPNGKIDRKSLPRPEQTGMENRSKIMPATETEKMVSTIWSEVLGIEQIGIEDDFFELGGHSLIAVRVLRIIEEKTGKRLPITALFLAPTVEKLSNLLDQGEKVIYWKSLVPIKPEGQKPPLYIVHGSGLTVLVFHALAMGLDPDQPVYGLQARGLNGVDKPFDTIEEIAAFYIEEILQQNPNGPYSLAGYSFGGIVAFEMAKQLKAKGKEVNMLAIFDTNVDNSGNINAWSLRMRKKLKRQFPKFKFIMRSFMKNPAGTMAYQFKFLKYKVIGLLEATHFIRIKGDNEEQLEHADMINQHHEAAFRKYEMKPYNGSIDLFRAKNRMYFLDDLIYLGWKPYALQGLNIHEISGDHKTFLLSPNVQSLSKMLRGIIIERNNEKKIIKDFTNPSSVLKAI